MNILKDELMAHKDFIRLTRDYPTTLKACSYSQNGISYKLLDSAVLQIEPQIEPQISGLMDIVISSGIHGNETAPIEICNDLIRNIIDGKIKVANRILFITGNPPAMLQGKRFIAENLNRLFCSKYVGKYHAEATRAENLEKYMGDFFNPVNPSTDAEKERCHFDLHTAIRASKHGKFAIYPFQNGKDWNKAYLNFFKDSDINTILLGHQPAGTFSYYSSNVHRANAFTVELGQVKPFGQNDMSLYYKLIINLTHLITNEYHATDEYSNSNFNLYQVVDEVVRHSDDNFSLNIDVDVANFTEFPIGFRLTSDDNNDYIFKSEQQAIVFPNADVPVGNRVALIVEKTNI
jgi:succinylglutamate desuccinylase